MSKYYTTDTLIESIKRRAMLPTSQNTFKEEDFLAFANEELDLGIVPHILSFHEDYLMYTELIPLQSGIVRYEIPSRAMGNKIREAAFQDTDGIIYEMTRIFIEDLPYFQIETSGSLSGSVRSFYVEGNELVLTSLNNTTILTGNLRVSYYVRPSELVNESRVGKVTSVNYSKGIIQLDSWPDNFSDTPKPLIDITSSRSPFRILGFGLSPDAFGNSTNPTLTMGTINEYTITCLPPGSIIDSSYIGLRSTISGTQIDYVLWFDKTGSSTPPTVSGSTLIQVDISTAITSTDVAAALTAEINTIDPTNLIATNITNTITIQNAGDGICVGNNFQFNSGTTTFTVINTQIGTNTIPTNVRINDVVSNSEETIIPQVPLELHSMLAQRVVMRCLEALGDIQGLQAAASKLQEMELKTGSIIDNRVEGAPLKVSPKHTFLRKSRIYLRR